MLCSTAAVLAVAVTVGQIADQHIILKSGTQVFAVVDFGPAWVAGHVER